MKAEKLDIHKYGDPVLRQKAQPVGKIDAEIRRLVQEMIDTMRVERGVGLAAQQVGETRSVCIVDVPDPLDTDENGVRHNPDIAMPMVLVNPEILEFSKQTEVGDEGCLSFPGIYAPVKRSVEIKLRYQDLETTQHVVTLKNFVARVAQHEIDHLNGILLVDRMSRLKKIALSGQLKRMKKETQEAIGVA